MVVGWWWGDSGETGSGGMWLNLRQERHCWDMVGLGNRQGAEFPAETEKHSNDGMIAAYFFPRNAGIEWGQGKDQEGLVVVVLINIPANISPKGAAHIGTISLEDIRRKSGEYSPSELEFPLPSRSFTIKIMPQC